MKKVAFLSMFIMGACISFNASAQDIKQKKQVPVKSEKPEKIAKEQPVQVLEVQERQEAPQQVTSGSKPLNRVQPKQPVRQRVPVSERSDIKKN